MKISRRAAVRTFTFLLAALLCTTGFWLCERRRTEAAQTAIQNTHLHAFYELSAAVNEIDASLQKSSFVTSPSILSSLCTRIFGQAQAAQMALGELPYGNIELEQTADFLARVGDYAFALSREAASGRYDDRSQENLASLHKNAATLSASLSSLQGELLSGSRSLSTAEEAEARLSALEDGELPPSGGSFQEVESEFPEFPTLVYDGPFSSHLQSRTFPLLENEAKITPAEGLSRAASALSLPEKKLTFLSEGAGEIPAYSYHFVRDDGADCVVRITCSGGYLLSLSCYRPAREASLSVEEGRSAAVDFLTSHGFSDMKESYYIIEGGILTVNFAYCQGDVTCYPDLVKVSVFLDSGRIAGFEAEGYLSNHTARDLPSPAVSADDARAHLSPRLSVLSQGLALIPTEGKSERLCHELICEDEEGRHYLLYVNVLTGDEEQILILLEDESGTLVL